MKKEINILPVLLIILVVIVVIAALFAFSKDRIDYDKLTEVSIKKMGTMIPSGDKYTLKLEKGTWVASHNRIEWLEENIVETDVDYVFASNIKEMLKKNKAHKWGDFDIKYEIRKKLMSMATDGVNYYFYMKFSDGREIIVEEYNIYPENFMTVLKAFEKQYEILTDE